MEHKQALLGTSKSLPGDGLLLTVTLLKDIRRSLKLLSASAVSGHGMVLMILVLLWN